MEEQRNPTVSVEGARQFLGYRSKESIFALARKGKKGGGIDAYVFAPDEHEHYRWQLRAQCSHRGRFALQFYAEELSAWKAVHRRILTQSGSYTREEQQEVLMLASSLQNAKGRVHREALHRLLHERMGWKKTSMTYKKMRQILEDADIPGLHRLPVSVWKTNPPSSHEALRTTYEEVSIAEE